MDNGSKQCDGCVYWKSAAYGDSRSGLKCCHFFLDTLVTRRSACGWVGPCTVRREKQHGV